MEKIKKILVSKSFKDSGKKFFVTNTDKDYHTKFGFVKAEELKKAKPGSELTSNNNEHFIVMKPEFVDMYKRIKRGAQIISLKDIAAIIAETAVGKDSIVLDSGSGSGALSLFMANIVKHVYSYEIDKEGYDIVKENIDFLGTKNLTLKNKDVYEGIDEEDLDLIVFDLPEPWKAVKHAKKALKLGGFLVNYSPCIPPLMEFVDEIKKNSEFMTLKIMEMTETKWEFKDRVVRPLSKGIGHTGFLLFARKIQ